MMIDRSVIWGAPDYHFSTLTKGFQITGSEFAYFPRFFGAELGGSCRVDATKCLEGTCVHGVQFPPFTQFTRVSFRPSAIFFDVHFGAGACFSGVNFGDSGTFHHVVFEGPCRFERCKFGLPSLIETDLRGAVFQQVEFTSTSVPSDGRSWSARLAALDGWFKPVCRWDRVRAVGELQVLTRASYLALILVPILAGCWGVVQRQLEGFGKSMPLASVIDEVAQDVEKTARFPLSLALVFFAAAFVLLGHLLYQAKAPSLIKSRSRDEHMDDMTARYRSDSPEGRKERLREAIDKLHAIPAYDTARAANLVNRHGETVWLPSKLEWYADPPEYPIEANSMTQLTRLRAAEPDGATTRAVSAYVKRFRPLLLTGAERERIAVEEGARAKYDIESHQHRPLAAVAGTAYLFGVLLILWVLGLQLYRIADTAGAPWLLGLIVLAVVIGVFVAWRSRGESRTAEVIRTFDRT